MDDVREPYYIFGTEKRPGVFIKRYLDTDLPTDLNALRWAKSTEEAKELCRTHGAPAFMYLDHDLGGADTSMAFLTWLARDFQTDSVPEYRVISANPIGSKNIRSFMESWKKSLD